jgi:hypothetical protein
MGQPRYRLCLGGGPTALPKDSVTLRAISVVVDGVLLIASLFVRQM